MGLFNNGMWSLFPCVVIPHRYCCYYWFIVRQNTGQIGNGKGLRFRLFYKRVPHVFGPVFQHRETQNGAQGAKEGEEWGKQRPKTRKFARRRKSALLFIVYR